MPETLELNLGATPAGTSNLSDGAAVSKTGQNESVSITGQNGNSKAQNVAVTPPQEQQSNVPPINGSEPETVKSEEVPEDYVWEGDADNLPKPLQNRAKGVLRYLTKQSQSLAEERKMAEEYKKVKSDPAYQQFLNYKQSNQMPQQNQVQAGQAPALYTREELEEAQVNPEKLGELINRGAEARFKQAEQEVGGIISELRTKQTFIDKKQELQDFSEVHPDFWDLHEKGLIKPFIREIVDTGQGTLMDAYNKAKEVREQFRQEALRESQVRVSQKKSAFSSPPTPSNETEIIWANSKNEATKIAFDNAVLGKKVNVKVKK